ncbi:hypothetical protein EJ110_NYTH22404 [Nymphaea thermarum]|nr:hypothetical protein EJ110_NYTH22404 [Nymphaea thermarum]
MAPILSPLYCIIVRSSSSSSSLSREVMGGSSPLETVAGRHMVASLMDAVAAETVLVAQKSLHLVLAHGRYVGDGFGPDSNQVPPESKEDDRTKQIMNAIPFKEEKGRVPHLGDSPRRQAAYPDAFLDPPARTKPPITSQPRPWFSTDAPFFFSFFQLR